MAPSSSIRFPSFRDSVGLDGPILIERIPAALERSATPTSPDRIRLPFGIAATTPRQTTGATDIPLDTPPNNAARVLLDWGADVAVTTNGGATARIGGIVVLAAPRHGAHSEDPPAIRIARVSDHGLAPLSVLGARDVLDLTNARTRQDRTALAMMRAQLSTRLAATLAAAEAGTESENLSTDAAEELRVVHAARARHHDGAIVAAWHEALPMAPSTIQDAAATRALCQMDRPSERYLAGIGVTSPDLPDAMDEVTKEMYGAGVAPVAAVWISTITHGEHGRVPEHELAVPHGAERLVITKSARTVPDEHTPGRAWSKLNLYSYAHGGAYLIGQASTPHHTLPPHTLPHRVPLMTRQATSEAPRIPSQSVAETLMAQFPINQYRPRIQHAALTTAARLTADGPRARPDALDDETSAALVAMSARHAAARMGLNARREQMLADRRAHRHAASAASAIVDAAAALSDAGPGNAAMSAIDDAMRPAPVEHPVDTTAPKAPVAKPSRRATAGG